LLRSGPASGETPTATEVRCRILEPITAFEASRGGACFAALLFSRGPAGRFEEFPMAKALNKARQLRTAPLKTPTDIGSNAAKDVSAALNAILADTFALYMKTKNFHWHASGPHFRSLHLLFDEQAAQIYATTDDLAERVRKLGNTTLRSIGRIARLQRIDDNDADFVDANDMLSELREDNQHLVASLREAHGLCDESEDVASASLIENWIDEAEKRIWFLFEACRRDR
jgi:starvation-inducible DNA-binding protein